MPYSTIACSISKILIICLWGGCEIVQQQMAALRRSGLIDSAGEFVIGVNGGLESRGASCFLLPRESKKVFHGLNCRTENRTIVALEKWVKTHPDWHVLYFHSKGVTHPNRNDLSKPWRECMMRHLIDEWQKCVRDLDAGYEAVGCHWMEPPLTPKGQRIFAGNFWWAKSNYLNTLPSIMDSGRIKISGLDSYESRYESEVWLAGGKRIPKIKDYHGPNWHPGKVKTCV